MCVLIIKQMFYFVKTESLARIVYFLGEGSYTSEP